MMKKVFLIVLCFTVCVFGFEHCASKNLHASSVHMKGGTKMQKEDFIGPWICCTKEFGTENVSFNVDANGSFSITQGTLTLEWQYMRVAASKKGAIFKIETIQDGVTQPVRYCILGVVESVAYMSSIQNDPDLLEQKVGLEKRFAKHADLF